MEENELRDLLKKIEGLTAESKPNWGKMTSQHMIEHLILAVKMSNGKLNVECFNPAEKLPTLKRFLLSARPLPHNFVNPILGEDLLPLEFDSLEKAKSTLYAELENYFEYFRRNPDHLLTNATFGELNKQEWDVFHKKHFEHHLNQFGLINK